MSLIWDTRAATVRPWLEDALGWLLIGLLFASALVL